MRPPEGIAGITKATIRKRIRTIAGRPLAALIFVRLSRPVEAEAANITSKDVLHVQGPLRPGDVPIAIQLASVLAEYPNQLETETLMKCC